MVEGVKCFFLEPTGKLRRSLRRFKNGEGRCRAMTGQSIFHHADAPFDTIEDKNPHGLYSAREQDAPPRADRRWPRRCACGHRFSAEDTFQLVAERIYRRSDTGEEVTLAAAPPGAMWFADWMPKAAQGPDGRCLVVRCPDGYDWIVDARASDCTKPGDDEHICWVRGGFPQYPSTLLINKDGLTCGGGHWWVLDGVLFPH